MAEESDKDLNYILKELDDKHFEGKLRAQRMSLAWSYNLHCKRSRMSRPRDGRPAVIHLSWNLLGPLLTNELKEIVLEILNKASREFEVDTIADQLERLKIEIGERCEQRSVKFEMDAKIRAIELENLADKRLEQLDSHPDIQILFKEYDNRYFDGILHQNEVELYWCDRLTNSAGICHGEYLVKGRPIRIGLSRKLLKHEKRSHLVSTLLHEMIHAFIFAKQIPEKGTHGPKFCAWMRKLNAITGANITIFHDLEFDPDAFLEKHNKHLKDKGIINDELDDKSIHESNKEVIKCEKSHEE